VILWVTAELLLVVFLLVFYKEGAWGFASNPELDEETIKQVIASATKNALFIDLREKMNKPKLPNKKGSSENDFTTTKPKKLKKR